MLLLRSRLVLPAILILALLVYATAVSRLARVRVPSVAPELVITLPRLAQVVFAAGDRYLAADLAGFRVLIASTDRMRRDDFAVQARLQDDIAWLNPAHEDNYYIAAALLPWSGELDVAQRVLRRAGDARPFDWQPLFYYAFDRYHFLKDPRGAAAVLLEAAPRATEQNDQWTLQQLAAKWAERGYDAASAANVVEGMVKASPPGAFRAYLGKRADRLRSLARLKAAAQEYALRKGGPPAQLEDLVAAGLIPAIPVDPLNQGFALSAQGEPEFRTLRPKP